MELRCFVNRSTYADFIDRVHEAIGRHGSPQGGGGRLGLLLFPKLLGRFFNPNCVRYPRKGIIISRNATQLFLVQAMTSQSTDQARGNIFTVCKPSGKCAMSAIKRQIVEINRNIVVRRNHSILNEILDARSHHRGYVTKVRTST